MTVKANGGESAQRDHEHEGPLGLGGPGTSPLQSCVLTSVLGRAQAWTRTGAHAVHKHACVHVYTNRPKGEFALRLCFLLGLRFRENFDFPLSNKKMLLSKGASDRSAAEQSSNIYTKQNQKWNDIFFSPTQQYPYFIFFIYFS